MYRSNTRHLRSRRRIFYPTPVQSYRRGYDRQTDTEQCESPVGGALRLRTVECPCAPRTRRKANKGDYERAHVSSGSTDLGTSMFIVFLVWCAWWFWNWWASVPLDRSHPSKPRYSFLVLELTKLN
ncbi:hypothetical protein GWI33_006938 [Rhynchophorus ferrugineus]|uniref:Uncharacterized protein n=1 Tax=Rhynchophorus ferrugineus TaxID=354439 RepID=A0A834IGW1_RHYFE|nr:hypothetical protein GWI33_006938 [Rhynchophorus ferrugineus]